jgi:hypothetical protein
MPPMKSAPGKGKKNNATPKRKPGRPAAKKVDEKKSAKSGGSPKKGIYLEDYMSESSDSEFKSVKSSYAGASASSRRKREDGDHMGIDEDPEEHGLFLQNCSEAVSVTAMNKSFVEVDQHLSKMYGDNPGFQRKVYHCAVQAGYDTVGVSFGNQNLQGQRFVVRHPCRDNRHCRLFSSSS